MARKGWLRRIRSSAEAPVLDARAFDRSFAIVLVVFLAILPLVFFAGGPSSAASLSIAFAIGVCMFGLARLGHRQLASLGALLAMIGALTYQMWGHLGLHSIALVGYPAVIALGGLYLTRPRLVLLTIAAVLSLLAVTWAEIEGAVASRYAGETSVSDFLLLTVVLASLAFFVDRMSTRLRAAASAARHSHEALQSSEERFRALTENISDVIVVLDPDGTVRYVSPTVREVLGYRPEDRVGRAAFDLVHPDDLPTARRELASFVAQPGARSQLELRMRHRDGDWRAIEIGAHNLIDVPSVRGLVLNYRDVTERRRITEALAQSEARLRLAMESAAMGIWEWDVAKDQVFWEEQLSAVLGSAPRPLPASREAVLELVHPDDREKILLAFERGLADGGSMEVEFRVTRPDGELRWATTSARLERGPDGAPVRLIGVVCDATERKRAEEALRESERKFVRMFQANPSAMSITAADGRILDVNESMVSLTGWSRDEMIGRAVVELDAWVDDAEREQTLSSLRESGVVRGREVRLRRRDGAPIRWVLSAERLELSGQPCVLWSAIDVTESRNLSEQLLRAQKMDALGRLAGGVAHDFKNWLTPILGYSDLVLARMPESDPRRAEISEIRNAGQRAAELATQLLRFSRGEMTRPRVLDLNELVAGMDRLLRRIIGEDVELITDLEPQVGLVHVDPIQIEQVILNLAVNARDAMPSGGRMTLETRALTLGEGARVLLAPGRYVVISITDDGCGMDAQTLGRIFEPFFTTKDVGKGIGLGLSTAYGIVQQSAGDIAVSSEVGKGTRVEVYLPVVDGTRDIVAPETAPRALGGNETVLLVEDQDAVRDFAAAALRSFGYSVLAADSGPSALQLSAELGRSIDVLVTDVVMPGMSGPELATRFLRQRPDCSLVYVSGHTRVGVADPVPLEPRAPFLHKPFTAVELARTVRQALGRP